MLIFPAIDIQNGQCVRLHQGVFGTAQVVAADPLETARSFARAGAQWVHMVDLDGARAGRPVNREIFRQVARQSGLRLELGGGIRDLETIDAYLSDGVSRVILGSVALKNPALVEQAVARYGERIAVGIDARDGMVATEGWLEESDVNYIDLAREMERRGVRCLVFTDISRDGTLSGPNLEQLDALNSAVSCDVIASGGIKSIEDIKALAERGLYGAICGKSLYQGTLDLQQALECAAGSAALALRRIKWNADGLIPAVIQQWDTGEVLMLAYMNEQSLRRTMETKTTWFYSRSRQKLWNKGESSGHVQRVVSLRADCDYDTLLVQVDQTGPACHTGSHNCFFNDLTQ